MPLPLRFQRYDSLIDLLVEQAVADVLEGHRERCAADDGEAMAVGWRPETLDAAERGESRQ